MGAQEPSSQPGLQLRWPLCTSHILATPGHPISLDPLLWVCWDTASSSGTALWVYILLAQALPGFPSITRSPFCFALHCLKCCFDGLSMLTFASAFILAPEFVFEMKDSEAGHRFVATNLHLENNLGAKPTVCSAQLWVPHLPRWCTVPKELSQLCCNMVRWGRAEGGEEKQHVSLLVL